MPPRSKLTFPTKVESLREHRVSREAQSTFEKLRESRRKLESNKNPGAIYEERASSPLKNAPYMNRNRSPSFDSGYDSLVNFDKYDVVKKAPHPEINNKMSKTNKESSEKQDMSVDKKMKAKRIAKSSAMNPVPFHISTDRGFPLPEPSNNSIADETSSIMSALSYDFENDYLKNDCSKRALESSRNRIPSANDLKKKSNGSYDNIQVVSAEESRLSEKLGGPKVSDVGPQKENNLRKFLGIDSMLKSCRREIKVTPECQDLMLLEVTNNGNSNDLSSNLDIMTISTENSTVVPNHTSGESLLNYSTTSSVLQMKDQNAIILHKLRQSELQNEAYVKRISELESAAVKQTEMYELLEHQLRKSNQTRMEMESDLETVVAEVVELRHQIFLKGEKNGNTTKLSVL
jgi:hypothetical protein